LLSFAQPTIEGLRNSASTIILIGIILIDTSAQKAVTASHRNRHILNYRFLCYLPFRHPKPISNLSKGGIVSGDPPQKSGHSISL